MAADRLGLLGAVAVGVVLGFVLGGIGPRRELARVEDEVSRLQDEVVKLENRQARRSPLSMMGLDRVGADDRPPPTPRPQPPAPAPAPDDDGEQRVVEVEEVDPIVAEEPRSREDIAAEFDAAVAAQRLRMEQSRAALIEQADLDDAEIRDLDAAMGDMNARLGELGDQVLDIALSGQEPDSRDMLHLTHEVSGILYDAQVELDSIVGETADVDSSAREVWNHIDLDTFRDAVEAAEDAGWEQ